MRPIKFRGLTKEGKWVYGWLCNPHDVTECAYIAENPVGANVLHNDGTRTMANWHMVIPSTVGQFTGLKDKNGREIYESDILRYTHPHLEHPVDFKVIYYGECFSQQRLTTKDEYLPQDATDNIWYEWYQLEVIGTIHDKEAPCENS